MGRSAIANFGPPSPVRLTAQTHMYPAHQKKNAALNPANYVYCEMIILRSNVYTGFIFRLISKKSSQIHKYVGDPKNVLEVICNAASQCVLFSFFWMNFMSWPRTAHKFPLGGSVLPCAHWNRTLKARFVFPVQSPSIAPLCEVRMGPLATRLLPCHAGELRSAFLQHTVHWHLV